MFVILMVYLYPVGHHVCAVKSRKWGTFSPLRSLGFFPGRNKWGMFEKEEWHGLILCFNRKQGFSSSHLVLVPEWGELLAQKFAAGSYPQGYLNSQAKQATLSTSLVVKHTPTVEDSSCALYLCLRCSGLCSGLCSACPGRHPGNHPKHSSVTPSRFLPCLECTPGMICSNYSRKRSWWWSILNWSKIKGEPK